MAVMWSNDKLMVLIQMFRSKAILWDSSRKEYKDKNKKNDAYQEISRILGIPQKHVETKLHILRTQFCREKKKMTAKKSLNGESDGKCKWIFYEPLKFLLRGTNTSGKSETNIKMPFQEIETINCDRPHYEPQRTDYEAVDNHVNKLPIEVSREYTPPEKPVTRKIKYYETVSSTVKPNVENTFQDDDLTAFGNYVVSTLRKLDARNCVAAQDEIYTVLSKYKLSQLANSEATLTGPSSTPSASTAKSESPCSQDENDGW